jgi:NADH-quinone oxidoreductase subunit G
VLPSPTALPDLRVLAGISEELAALGQGAPLGFRTVADVRAEMAQLGPWDGDRPTMTPVSPTSASGEGLALSTWKLMIDGGSMQDGDKHLAATARPAVARVSPATYAALGAEVASVTVSGDRGSVTMPVEVVEDMTDGTVWVPASSSGAGVLVGLASPGSRVTVKGAGA